MRRQGDAAITTEGQIVAGVIIGNQIVVTGSALVRQEDTADIIVDRIAFDHRIGDAPQMDAFTAVVIILGEGTRSAAECIGTALNRTGARRPRRDKCRAGRIALADSRSHRLIIVFNLIVRNIDIIGVFDQDAFTRRVFGKAALDTYPVHPGHIDGMIQRSSIQNDRVIFAGSALER